jgi:Outer membrane protein
LSLVPDSLTLFAATIAIAAATAAPAQAPLSVETALEQALAHNPRVAAVIHDLRAARQGVRAAGALANPQVAFTPALTGGVGGGSDNELFIAQPLEVNGARSARRGAAEARLRETEAEAAVLLRDVVYEVRAAYYELVRAREQAALARDILAIAGELDRLARVQVELGARPAIEQVQTGIEVAKARQQVALAEASVAAKEAALNALLNRPPSAPLGPVALPAADADTPALAEGAQEAEQQALAQRSELAAGRARVEASRQEARAARAEGVPDVAPQFRATSVTRGVQQSGFGVGITLPFFDYGGRRGRARQAEESARAEEARVAALTAQVRQEVARVAARVRAAEAVLATYPEGLLAQAKRLLDASRLGYEEGKTTIVALLESQRTYRQIQSDYIDARVELALARAERERATGAYPAGVALAAAERRAAP